MSAGASIPHRILVAGPAWVGDMVMAQSLFKTLAAAYPGGDIDVLAPRWSQPLLARMPEVRSSVLLPVGHGALDLTTRRALGVELRERRYDWAIILPRSFKSALIPWFARIPRRTGYRGEMRFGLINDMRPLDREVLPQTGQCFVALGVEPGSRLPPPVPPPRLTVDTGNATRAICALGVSADKPAIAMMPGAEYGPAKQWPLESYAGLARRLVALGFEIWLIGSQRDRADAQRIRESAGGSVVNLCGRTELVDAVDLIAHTQLAISNDSGLMHVAAAVGRPLVAIYGSSSPDRTPPLVESAAVLYHRLECSPCFERRCPLEHLRCLREISVDEVYAAAIRLLARAGGA